MAVLLLVSALGITSLIFLKKEKQLDMELPYDISEELYGTHGAEVELQKASSYADSLCVAAENVTLNGISVSSQIKSALFDLEKKEVLFAQGMHERVYPASITKVMTGILAVKYGNMEEVLTVPQEALNLEEGSTEIGFQAGDQVTMDELFHGLLVYSGNDAAMTIARHLGDGSVDRFVEMMNEEAAAIGATNTHFVNPSGLHNEEHYTTVYDIYLMLNEALKYPHFVEVMQLSGYNITFTRGGEEVVQHLDATDQYLTKQVTPPKNVTVLGGKTGTTSDAGSCLALVSQNAYGQPFISIVMHAPTKTVLYNSMNQLLEWINT